MEASLAMSAAKLCLRCLVLQFDDSQVGSKLQLPSRRSVLAIHESDVLTQRSPSSTTTPLQYLHQDKLPDLRGLRESAETGCDFCRTLREAIINTRLRGKRDGKIKIKLGYLWHRSSTTDLGLRALVADLSIEMSEEENKLFHTDRAGFLSNWNFSEADIQVDDAGTVWQMADFIVFTVEAGNGNCDEWLRLEPPARSNALCVANLEDLRRQVGICDIKCVHPSTSKFVPTRLLDLDESDSTDGIRLLETKDLLTQQSIQYAALSYCWGPPEDAATQFITTRSSLSQRKRDIPFSSMSSVMKDTVKVSRGLGLRYVWIDAVCIIQDDARDWETEAGQMGDVYFNALVTIVALASSSCHQGFLHRPSPLRIPFRSSVDSSVSGDFRLRHVTFRGKDYLRALVWRSHDMDLSFSTWTTRAWTAQEMELSQRLVYFGTSRVWFSCVQRDVVEPFHDGGRPSEPRMATDLLLLTDDDMVQIYDDWLALLADFCGRKITKRSDRFPAISGLAKRVGEVLRDAYVAGLWKLDLPRGLLFVWMSECKSFTEHITLVAPSPDYLAPTWSPLVSTGHVEYQLYPDFVKEVEILSASTTPVSQFNAFGQISQAQISIRGRTLVLPCDLEKAANARREFRNQWWTARLDTQCTISCRLDWESPLTVEPMKERVLLLLVGSYQDDEEDLGRYSGGNRDAVGIILHPATDNKYHRVGWFECLVDVDGFGGRNSLQLWDLNQVTIL